MGRVRAALLAAACLALVSALRRGRRVRRPHAPPLYVNGKHVPIVPIVGGSDDYAQLHAKTMLVEARWAGDAHGSGYLRAPLDRRAEREGLRDLRRRHELQRSRTPVPLGIDIETSWYVQIVSTKGHKVVAGYKYCLVRYS